MAAVAGPRLWETGDRPMSKTSRPSISAVETSKGPLPVKVRLMRVNCNEAIPYPPDGQAREWWQRLKNAFGTTSSAFVQASLYQLIAAASGKVIPRSRTGSGEMHLLRWRHGILRLLLAHPPRMSLA